MKIYKQSFSARQTRTKQHHVATEDMLNDTGAWMETNTQKYLCQLTPWKGSVKSINSYGNTTSKITGIQTNGHTANFSYRSGSKTLVLQEIWNT